MLDHSFQKKARESLRAAQLLLESGCVNSVANRSYYAAFHAARAAIIASGLSTSEKRWAHEALQGKFSELIRQKKAYPSHIKSYLMELIAVRELADYGLEMVSLRVAKECVRKATEFVTLIEKAIPS
jgi:uncharacterized protein (UPF0332 family)